VFGLLIGALAVALGVMNAVLERPAPSSERNINRLCVALLTGCAVVTVAGGVAMVTVYR
jgi:uncharacterized membrane protein